MKKEKFCELTHTDPDCWIFDGYNVFPMFWADGDRVFFSNGTDTVWQFMDMKEYGEIWASNSGMDEYDHFTPWMTWCVYD